MQLRQLVDLFYVITISMSFNNSIHSKVIYRKSSIKRPLSNERLPHIKRPPLEPFCTKRPSLISALP